MFFRGALIILGWGVVGWGKKSYLGPVEIASSSSRDLIDQINKQNTFCGMLYRLDISTFYFYETIAVSDFPPFESHSNLKSLLSAVNFTVSSHADNHF